MLVVGTWRHGFDQWDAMNKDPDLHLTGKLSLDKSPSTAGVKVGPALFSCFAVLFGLGFRNVIDLSLKFTARTAQETPRNYFEQSQPKPQHAPRYQISFQCCNFALPSLYNVNTLLSYRRVPYRNYYSVLTAHSTFKPHSPNSHSSLAMLPRIISRRICLTKVCNRSF